MGCACIQTFFWTPSRVWRRFCFSECLSAVSMYFWVYFFSVSVALIVSLPICGTMHCLYVSLLTAIFLTQHVSAPPKFLYNTRTCLCPSVNLTVCLYSLSLSVCLFAGLSICLSICLSNLADIMLISVPVYKYLFYFAHLSAWGIQYIKPEAQESKSV
jgi:hypothetical protein